MMIRRFFPVLIAILLVLCDLTSGFSQVKITKSVISQGGSVSNSKNFQALDVLGQATPAGFSGSSHYDLQAGFIFRQPLPPTMAPHFTFTANTGDSYSIIVNNAVIDGQPPEPGDEIGVFTPAGLCVGASVWTGTTPLGLTAWVDDSQTPQVTDGYTVGDSMFFRIWDQSAGQELKAKMTVVEGNGTFGFGAYASVNLSTAAAGSPSITVLAPNGGETLTIGDQFEIKWTSENFNLPVTIEYSIDGNASHLPVVDSTDNDGSYLWTVPDTPTNQGIIIISEIKTGQPSDISDAVFTIKTPVMQGSIVVVNTNDSGTGSLRAAIEQANTQSGPDTIRFAIPKKDPGFNLNTGVWTIKPMRALPIVVDSGTVLDGRTQSVFIGEDSNKFGPEIEIDGTNAGSNTVGLYFLETANVSIFDLVINNFGGVGIWMWEVETGLISGCYIGVNAQGTEAAGNYDGIDLSQFCYDIDIGEVDSLTTPNIISANQRIGIMISDSCAFNVIDGNIIGLNRELDGLLGNKDDGIAIQRDCDSNYVLYNYIGGNSIGISVYQSKANEISDNFIGTDEDLNLNLGNINAGIHLFGQAQSNIIEKNIIGFNQGGGIYIYGNGTIGNRISRNSIFQNNNFGIVLDQGGNTLIPAPVILSAAPSTISGKAGPGQTIEIFTDDANEGKIFLGSTVADPAGNFTLALINPGILLANVTATATDSLGNSSGFSDLVVVGVEKQTRLPAPTSYRLNQNYPNPFGASHFSRGNPETEISYQLPIAQKVSLTVFNLKGEKIATLVNKYQTAGYYSVSWNGTDELGNRVANGVYLYKITAGSFKSIGKMTFLK